jgi:predicted ArsR family transcriptional regulator
MSRLPAETTVAGTDEALPSGAPDLDKDVFLRRMIRELTGALEDVVGADDAAGYVATVGAVMGEWLDAAYRSAAGVDAFDVEEVARVLVDLKRRIDGGFFVRTVHADRIVLGNTRCPFGEAVHGRPSLCMMTSNVFGRIAADNLGYASVRLDRTIAAGDGCCEVTIFLDRRPDADPHEREYYKVPRLDAR